MKRFHLALFGLSITVAALAGCAGSSGTAPSSPPRMTGLNSTKKAEETPAPTDEVALERAKLSPEDRKLVEAQEWCVISSDEKLGSMGAPIKLDIKGQPVFVCCKGCQRKAEADPDATLAKVAELKAGETSALIALEVKADARPRRSTLSARAWLEGSDEGRGADSAGASLTVTGG